MTRFREYRCLLAVLLVAFPASAQLPRGRATPQALQDLVITRGGEVLKGQFLGCVAASCSLGGVALDRAELAWIGFSVAPPPPAPTQTAVDEVHRCDGRVEVAKLVGINSREVVTERGSFPRTEVKWIHLAPPLPSSPGPGAGSHVQPTAPPGSHPTPAPTAVATPGSPQPTPRTTPQPSPVPTPRPTAVPSPPANPTPPPPSPGYGERGALWLGEVRIRHYGTTEHGYRFDLSVTVQVRLRERPQPLFCRAGTGEGFMRVGTLVHLDYEGTGLESHFRYERGAASCSGSGSSVLVRPEPGVANSSVIFVKAVNIDTTACLGFDIPLGARSGVYFLHFDTKDQLPYTCTEPGVAATSHQMEFDGPSVGVHLGAPAAECGDQEVRRLEADGTIMRGTYATRCIGLLRTVSWSICREGVRCPPPPEFPSGGPGAEPSEVPPTPDPCGDLARDQANVDVLWEQRQAYAQALEQDWQRLQEAHGAMLDNLEGYKALLDACAIWDIVGETMEGGAGNAGELVEFITKLVGGDLSYLVPSDTWGPLAERLVDAFPSEANWSGNMRSRIEGCGAPVGHSLRRAALDFVSSWEQVRQLMPQVQQQINRIRDKDLRYWEQWNRFYRSCRQWAQCKGLSPEGCPPPPAQPAGPMPRPSFP